MKRVSLVITIVSALFFAACYRAGVDVPTSSPAVSNGIDAKGDPKAGLDERTENALLAALADERRAQATYEGVLEKFGEVTPFSNIVNAEKRHESFLLPLFEKYAVRVPENEFSSDRIQLPMTLAEACQSAVSGEKANIALYDGFLEFVREPDIRDTFIYLRDASKNNHLPAFERCAGARRGKAF